MQPNDALEILKWGVSLAVKRGAFTLDEAETVIAAYRVFQKRKRPQQPAEAAAPAPEAEAAP